MIDSELARRAEALGVSASYLDWRKMKVEASEQTLTAILDALGDPPDLPGIPAQTSAGGLAVPGVPRTRSWGFTIQLYSVRSRRSWGHGDLRDLANLAVWSARELGAGFLLVNPLHAAEPLPPVSPSPYLPMTRRYTSPLYLRIEDIPEYGRLPAPERSRVDALGSPLRARNATSDLIDRDAVWTAKRTALKIIYAVSLSEARRAQYERYRQHEGSDLDSWSAWCALAEQHGPDWRRWPQDARAQRPGSEVVARYHLQAEADFHSWLQWLADEQMEAAQRAALDAGMGTGVIHDLAVGVHPGGADAWAQQDLYVRGMSVGAPPDGFNQLGQDWGQPPLHPQRLAAAGYRPLAGLYASGLRHAGGLRVDHVMGLMRLWWVPEGMTPDRGAYVRYDHTATVGALADQAARAGALAIGEDLGTVDPWIRDYLAGRGILGTSLLWFSRESDGTPLRARHWRRNCMATVGTHDVPPVQGFLSGEQVTVRARLGLLTQPEEAERKESELMLSRWQDALEREGLIPPGPRPGAAEFTMALYAYLARTPAALVGVSLADAVGDRRTQNVPGTYAQYPNWRIPLCDGEGEAVLLEHLPEIGLLRAVAKAATPRPAGR